jgi:FlaA1/EpsC-like NDP-sugar epimerase/dTDP-4-amino-4,6-dideoxygalactose transaminase
MGATVTPIETIPGILRASSLVRIHVAAAGLVGAVSLLAAFGLRFELSMAPADWRALLMTLPLAVFLRFLFAMVFSLQRRPLRFLSTRDFVAVSAAVTAGSAVLSAIVLIGMSELGYSRSVLLMDWALCELLMLGLYSSTGVLHETLKTTSRGVPRVLVVGDGPSVASVVRDIRTSGRFHPAGLLCSDQPVGARLLGVRVLGSSQELAEVFSRSGCSMVVLVNPGLGRGGFSDMVRTCIEGGIEFIALRPGELSVQNATTRDDMGIESLLQREEVQIDLEAVRQLLTGKKVLVTGAGGSIGSELCRQIAAFRPAALYLLERSENSLFYVARELNEAHPEVEAIPLLVDVVDAETVRREFMKAAPDIVFHTAAHKHVGMMEQRPTEAMRNNVIGTWRVAEAAEAAGVRRFINISTDKAVRPTSYMGLSKRLAEIVLEELNRTSKTAFATVRFGNVAGSTGSVVRLFRDQIARGGPVTVTHPEARRYFMTIPEAIRLVLQAAVFADRRVKYVLDMRDPIRIQDLARTMIRLAGLVPGRDIEMEFTHLGKGEKLTEELSDDGEELQPTEHGRVMSIVRQGDSPVQLLERLPHWEEHLSSGQTALLLEELEQAWTKIAPKGGRAIPLPASKQTLTVPFYRPSVGRSEMDTVQSVLRSGWLTTGKVVGQFEAACAEYLGAKHAVAVNSCTAALHLALEAANIGPGDGVLVPAMTFAATAEVVCYLSATPILVDCDPLTLCVSPDAMEQAIEKWSGRVPLRAMMPVHYGGQMADMHRLHAIAARHGLRVIEDAAHTFPAFTRPSAAENWRRVGEGSDAACFSFYANKCITTGEGGLLTTEDEEFARRVRKMSLHGLSKDAWERFSAKGSWYYEIVEAGFKYNMTDVAAALGMAQLRRSDDMWRRRAMLAQRYTEKLERFGDVLETPVELENRKSSWHLYPVRLRLESLSIDRAKFIEELKQRNVGCSVHWMPLHLHPFYRKRFGTGPGTCPTATAEWVRLVTLPLFPDMTEAEQDHVCGSIEQVLMRARRVRPCAAHA